MGEFFNFIKETTHREDYQSFIYCLGIIPSLCALRPEDPVLEDIYEYLWKVELTNISQDQLYLFSPVMIALRSLIMSGKPRIVSDEMITKIVKLGEESYAELVLKSQKS